MSQIKKTPNKWGARSLEMIFTVMTILAAVPSLHAQSAPPGREARQRTIEGVLKEIADGYIYSEKTPEIARQIRTHEANGDYDAISGQEFARRLTRDLRSAAGDLHFEIEYSEAALPPEPAITVTPTRDQRLRAGRDSNYGFRKVEILEGNVGYIALEGFFRGEAMGDTLAAAMNFVANTDALIIDLRNNDGGRADSVAMFVSYFTEGNPQPLVGIYWKSLAKTVESFTSPAVQGRKYLDRKVCLLTGKDTISAGEGFSYNMKMLKLATVVGEVTAGAANPGGMQRIDDHFSMFLPTGKAVDPVTGGNWEGVGVSPDVAVSAADSLQRAHILALRSIQEKAEPQKKDELEKMIRRLEKK